VFRSSVITPTVLTLKTQIGGDILTCPNPYPVLVIANDGTGLGTANSKEEYCVLWNDYVRNNALGDIYPTADGCEFNFYGNVAPDYLKIHYAYSIQSYTAGTSTIDFTNNGGDDWDITFNINTDIPPQIPSGCTINNYDTNIIFYVAGVGTDLDSTSGTTTNYTKNISGQGAGVYLVSQSYNVYSGATQVGFFVILSLYKVDASGNLLAYFKCKGLTVNSVSGLNIDITANIEQSGNCLIEWYSYDSLFNPTLIGNGSIASLTLPTDCAYLIVKPVLDTTFTNDFPSAALIISTITIN